MEEIFTKAIPVLERIEAEGFEAYFVGGSVRDHLLGRVIHDIDLATSATPEEVKQIFSKTIDVGIQHGTVVVLFAGESYEITTFRADGDYEDYRRPTSVQFVRSLKEDLQRRDFTINALAMDRRGKLYDFFAGQADLKTGIIRAVGDPNERFSEDALRMMRAVRFASQLNFTIERNTLKAIKDHVDLLAHVSQERKTVEFEKLLLGKNVKQAIDILVQSKINTYLPRFHKYGVQLQDTFAIWHTDYLHTIEDYWSFITINLEMNSEKDLKQWKLANKKIKIISTINHFFKKYKITGWTSRMLLDAGLETALAVERLARTFKLIEADESEIQNLYESLIIKEPNELAITGHDLINWFAKPAGIWIKDTLHDVTDQVLLGQVDNNQEAIREYLYQKNKIQTIQQELTTSQIGQTILAFETVSSTQTIAKAKATELPHGTVIIAEEQTAGRGRLARKWHAPASQGVWLSIILKPQIQLEKTPQLTLVSAVSVVECLQHFGIQAEIKWPNDCQINGKKVSGILTEMSLVSNQVQHVIVGIGINLYQKKAEFSANIMESAISMEAVSRLSFTKEQVIQILLQKFENLYQLFCEKGFPAIKPLWENYTNTIGKYVRTMKNGEELTGIAIGITDEGLLQIKDHQEQIHLIYAGELVTE